MDYSGLHGEDGSSSSLLTAPATHTGMLEETSRWLTALEAWGAVRTRLQPVGGGGRRGLFVLLAGEYHEIDLMRTFRG